MDRAPETAESAYASSVDANLGVADLASERRGDNRASVTLMRSAKLICQSGEYICLLRDLSPGGVRIGMFHQIPPETHVFLETASGEVQAMIRMWERGTTAGFRFAKPVDPDTFLAELGAADSRQLSLRMRVPALAIVGGAVQPVTLTSLSQGAASMEADGFLAVCQSFMLSVEGLGECGAWVRMRRGAKYEIVFDTIHRLDQLAQQALVLQPIGLPEDQTVAIRGVA